MIILTTFLENYSLHMYNVAALARGKMLVGDYILCMHHLLAVLSVEFTIPILPMKCIIAWPKTNNQSNIPTRHQLLYYKSGRARAMMKHTLRAKTGYKVKGHK